MKKLFVVLALAGSLSSGIAATAQEGNFRTWVSEHPKWVDLHPDRIKFFRGNPEAAREFMHQNAVSEEKRAGYEEWAAEHPGWVAEHASRAEYFKTHPSEAEKARKEWAVTKETPSQAQVWIKSWQTKWKPAGK